MNDRPSLPALSGIFSERFTVTQHPQGAVFDSPPRLLKSCLGPKVEHALAFCYQIHIQTQTNDLHFKVTYQWFRKVQFRKVQFATIVFESLVLIPIPTETLHVSRALTTGYTSCVNSKIPPRDLFISLS